MKGLPVILALLLGGCESTLGAQPASPPNATLQEIKVASPPYPQPITIVIQGKNKTVVFGEYIVNGVVADRGWTQEELAQIKKYEGKDIFVKVTARPLPGQITRVRIDPALGGGSNVVVNRFPTPGQVSVVRIGDGTTLAADLIKKRLASKPTKARAK